MTSLVHQTDDSLRSPRESFTTWLICELGRTILYQYKREPLNGDEVSVLTKAYNAFGEELVVCTLLDTSLRLSEFADPRGGIPTAELSNHIDKC